MGYYRIILEEGIKFIDELKVRDAGWFNLNSGRPEAAHLWIFPFSEPNSDRSVDLFNPDSDLKDLVFGSEVVLRRFIQATMKQNLHNFLLTTYTPCECTDEFNAVDFKSVLKNRPLGTF